MKLPMRACSFFLYVAFAAASTTVKPAIFTTTTSATSAATTEPATATTKPATKTPVPLTTTTTKMATKTSEPPTTTIFVTDTPNAITTTAPDVNSTNTTTTTTQDKFYTSVYAFFFESSILSQTILFGGLFLGLLNTLIGFLYCCVLAVLTRQNNYRLKSSLDDPSNAPDIEMTQPEDAESKTPIESPAEPPPKLSAKQVKCQNVCKEIIATERSFCANMQTLHDVFHKGLQTAIEDKRNLIPAHDLNNIFQHVEPVLGVSKSLLDLFDEEEKKMLKERGENYLKTSLTERVVRTYKFIEPYLKVYAAFCNHYEESMDLLRGCWTDNSNLKKWLDTARHDPRCLGLGVVDMLIQPVQRICKYPLLFGELLKHLDSEENDDLRHTLEETHIMIKAAAKHVDRRAEDSIHQKKMNGLLSRLTPKKGVSLDLANFITPTRKFEFEIKIDILESTANKSLKPVSNEGVHLLLFSDLLLLGIPKHISDAIKYTKDGLFDLECPLLVTFASTLKALTVRNIADNTPYNLVPEKRCLTLLRHRNIGTKTSTDRLVIRFDSVKGKDIFVAREQTCTQSCFASEADLGDRREGMTKSWAKRKNKYLHKHAKSASLTSQLDDMADIYRNRSSDADTIGSDVTSGLCEQSAAADNPLRGDDNDVPDAPGSAPSEPSVPAGHPLDPLDGEPMNRPPVVIAAPDENPSLHRASTSEFIQQRYMQAVATRAWTDDGDVSV